MGLDEPVRGSENLGSHFIHRPSIGSDQRQSRLIVILDVASRPVRGFHFLIKPASYYSITQSLGSRTLLSG